MKKKKYIYIYIYIYKELKVTQLDSKDLKIRRANGVVPV